MKKRVDPPFVPERFLAMCSPLAAHTENAEAGSGSKLKGNG